MTFGVDWCIQCNGAATPLLSRLVLKHQRALAVVGAEPDRCVVGRAEQQQADESTRFRLPRCTLDPDEGTVQHLADPSAVFA